MLLPRTLVNQILAHAQRSPGMEICGLVGARDDEPVSGYPIPNIAETPETRFDMDPKAQIAAQKQMRERGERLFAVYHSHPTSPAQPSARDIAEAEYPEAVKLIVSLDTKGVLEMRAFQITAGQSRELALELEHPD